MGPLVLKPLRMSRLLTRSTLLVLGSTSFLATYCNVYDETLLLPGKDASSGAAGSGGSSGGSGGGGGSVNPDAGCSLATYPGPPVEKNLGTGQTIVLAMREIDFGETWDSDAGVEVPQ